MRGNSFARGVALLTAAAITAKLAGFLYRVVLTNLPGYGDAGNGLYGAGYQVYLVLYALSTTGFPSAIAKLVAERSAVGDTGGAHRVFRVAFGMLFFIGIAVSILFFAFSGFISSLISSPGTYYTMAALSPTIFFVSIMAVFRGYFQGMNDMSPQAGSQVIEQLGKTFFTILLAYVLLPRGLEAAAAGATMGTAIGAAIGALYLWLLYNRRKIDIWSKIRKSKTGTGRSRFSIIKDLLAISIPVSLGAVILTAANIIDLTTVMRSLIQAGFGEMTANRLYGILTGKCYVLTHFPVSVSLALSTSLVPAVAGAISRKDRLGAAAKINASLRVTMLIGLPSAVGLAVLADPILRLLFPGSSEGAELLSLSALSIVFIGFTQTMSGILQGLGKVIAPVIAVLAGAAVKTVINFALVPIPQINIKGAVYGTIACYVLSALICFIFLCRNLRLNLSLSKFIIKPLAAAIAMGAISYYLYGFLIKAVSSNLIALPATIAASALVYAVLLTASGVLTSKDISLLPFGKNIAKRLTG